MRIVERINARLWDPERTRWTCDADCEDCHGLGWIDDWASQCRAPCFDARPVGLVSVALWWTARLAWWAEWRARDLWMHRPLWVNAWWWRWKITGEEPPLPF